MPSKKVSRRNFLRLGTLTAAGAVLAGCGAGEVVTTEAPKPTEKATEKPTEEVTVEETAEVTAEPTSAYKESPMLADKVASGDLPPVEERLPETPRVVEVLGEIGQFGGTMRQGFTGTNPGWGGMWYVAGWECLTQWSADFSGVEMNIAENIEISDDVKEFTIHLRKGMKWSDGADFTADDIMFYIDDIIFDTDLSPNGAVADWLPADGADDFKAEKIDDYTVKFIFANPHGTFLYQAAQWNGRHIAFFPKHYLEQYHKKYNDKVDDLLEGEEGIEDWIGLFNKYAAGPTQDTQQYFNVPERPVLFPWVVTKPLEAGTTIEMARNPFYWKVDAEGNQLPYMDGITGTSYQDDQARLLGMLNGDLDFVKDPGGDNRIAYHDAVDEGKPLYIRYNNSDGANSNTIHFNRNTPDEAKAAIFENKDFRIGMSHAINRQEVIDIVHSGQGTPSQQGPLDSSPLYNEQCANQYLEYDVDLANEFLDKVIPDKGSDGYRLTPDGAPLSIIFTISNDLTYGTNWVQVAELLIGYWDKVGVKVVLNAVADEQYQVVRDENQMEATVYTGEGGAGITAILDPRYYVPMEQFGMFGNGWFGWRVKSTTIVQVEPPDWVKEWREKYEQEVLFAPSQEAQIESMKEIIQMAADEFWVLGISRPGNGYYPFHTRVANIPETWIDGWIEGVQKLLYPEQWYLTEEV
ncbi:MAG: ABC transporter substrate-binding protein [Anaerolineae bacterium]|nr:ABC transporter substrate-binding protein [Anaerolineae bacterium]